MAIFRQFHLASFYALFFIISCVFNCRENLKRECSPNPLVCLFFSFQGCSPGSFILCLKIVSVLVLLARACGIPAVVVRAVSFGRSTVGNDVVATILISLFRFLCPFFSSAVTFSHRRSARIKKLI